MAQKGKPRNPADYPVLGMLCHGQMHGDDLCRELQRPTGRNLDTPNKPHLCSAGRAGEGCVWFITNCSRGDGPDKKVFSVTDKGKEVFFRRGHRYFSAQGGCMFVT